MRSLPPGTAGCDLGATLTKVVTRAPREGEGVVTIRFPSADLEQLRAFLRRHRPRRIGVTGGGAASLPGVLEGAAVRRVSEFEAWVRGARLAAGMSGETLPDAAILVSLGTGVSIFHLRGENGARVGGTALGGGALHGLGRMLLGSESFQALAELAEQGDRTTVDLTVGDVYPRRSDPATGIEEAGLTAEVTAANFGKLASHAPYELEAADLAHAVVGLVGENVALLSGALAARHEVEEIVYCGTPVETSRALADILLATTDLLGLKGRVLPGGAYAGALGAGLLAAEAALPGEGAAR